jgi:hypothetical protein
MDLLCDRALQHHANDGAHVAEIAHTYSARLSSRFSTKTTRVPLQTGHPEVNRLLQQTTTQELKAGFSLLAGCLSLGMKQNARFVLATSYAKGSRVVNTEVIFLTHRFSNQVEPLKKADWSRSLRMQFTSGNRLKDQNDDSH